MIKTWTRAIAAIFLFTGALAAQDIVGRWDGDGGHHR